jgi:hypothetical protein
MARLFKRTNKVKAPVAPMKPEEKVINLPKVGGEEKNSKSPKTKKEE